MRKILRVREFALRQALFGSIKASTKDAKDWTVDDKLPFLRQIFKHDHLMLNPCELSRRRSETENENIFREKYHQLLRFHREIIIVRRSDMRNERFGMMIAV